MHNLKSITRNIVATITLHEATPGHHMQDAILSSSQILPRFVTQFVDLPGDLPSSIPSYMYVAYKEGWGLYSEYLGYDLGIYQNEPMKELGYIKGDLLRSARLVVDVGLHKYGWTREKAIEFLIDNTGFSKGDLENLRKTLQFIKTHFIMLQKWLRLKLIDIYHYQVKRWLTKLASVKSKDYARNIHKKWAFHCKSFTLTFSNALDH